MDEKQVIVIISDLHLGGGPGDEVDDHVCDQAQFSKFLKKHLLESAEGRAGSLVRSPERDLFR